MRRRHSYSLSIFTPALFTGALAVQSLLGCGPAPAGISTDSPGSSGSADPGSAGNNALPEAGQVDAGEANAGADSGHAQGGALHSGGASGSAGKSSTTGGGGLAENGGTSSDAGGMAQAGDDGEGVVIAASCAFHTDAMVGAGGSGGAAGAPGSGGAGGVTATITVQVSPFVGNYLADATGRTLYTYGADLPGDCKTPPTSLCVADCPLSWPIFPAGARVLAAGLDDAAFGAIHRDDGSWQTTYYGWPLYYYKSDLLLGQVTGHGKGKTWHVAQQRPPAVVILKFGTTKYLADVAGHTLYVSAADVVGGANADPVSSCAGTCLDTFEPFHEKNFSVVTSLLIADFASFARKGKGGLQVSYKGQPLYRAATDLKAGDMNGTSVTGFTPAQP